MPAGDASFFGFEYQIYASVFLMLIEHRNMSFTEMHIETPFGHDASILSQVSATFDSEFYQDKPLKISLNSINIVKQIQVKTKARHYMWHSSEFRKVLLKQDESNASAGNTQTVLDDLINNPQKIFIFFTDGVVHSDLAGLRTDPITLKRKQPNMNLYEIADSIINSTRDTHLKMQLQSLKAGILERVFIIESLEIDRLKRDICDIIYETYGIPYHCCTEKMQKLVTLIRKSMMREDGHERVTLSDLEKIVGSPSPKAPYPELVNSFVPIPEYSKALQILEQEHIVIICGEPCVGKTTLARAAVNWYFEKNYEYSPVSGTDAHLHIANACIKNETKTFLVDDGLGVINFESQYALADQLPQLSSQIKNAKGRIKLIVTTRRNVLAEAKPASRLGNANINPYIVNVSSPSPTHLIKVFSKLLADFGDEDKQLIQSLTPVNYFENLVHVRHFVDEVKCLQTKDSRHVSECFETSRPSEYQKWIQCQSPANQLCLFILWMLIETNGFITEDNLKRIYVLAEHCVQLPAPPPFGNWLDESLHDLAQVKNRIERAPDGALDFIHPHLRNAVKEFLWNHTSGILSFLRKLSIQLANTNHPLEQSVASMLCLVFRKQFGAEADQLVSKLLNSRFIQTIETIIRFGGIALLISFLDDIPGTDTGSTESKIDYLRRQFLYSPGQCKLDENGHLIKKRDTYDRFVLGSEAWDDFRVEMMLKAGRVSEQKDELFKAILQQSNFSILNSLERYEFAYWLHQIRDAVGPGVLLDAVKNLANDSVSFTRGASAIFIDKDTLRSSQEYHSIFQNLCYDSHPNVKIEILEQVILQNWRFMPEHIQDEWLRLVSDMLDDPIVRLYSSMGLIDQSGSHYEYHMDHSIEQKQKWFIALAPKLLQHGFTHLHHFDRFLTPVDKWFANFPLAFRVELLQSIAQYIEKNPSLSQDTIYSIEKVVLEGNLTLEENDICLRLISNLSSWGKSRICYTFATRFSELKDARFKEFLHYPFYNETESQFIAERAAAFLGFQANTSILLSELPPTLLKDNTNVVGDVLNNYCREENDDFKLLALMMAYGYGSAHHTGALYDYCFQLDIIHEIILYFARHEDLEKIRIVVEIILNQIHLWDSPTQNIWLQNMPIEQIKASEWFKKLSLFLYNPNSEICKCVCELVFASNIASSVHNFKTFLFLVHSLLDHPDRLVSDYAFIFFDKYFYEIKKIMFDRDLSPSWQKEISDTWFNEEFQMRLVEKSSVYKEWLQATDFFKTLGTTWLDFPENIRSKLLASIEVYPHKDRPEIIEILRRFYYRIQDSISNEQKEQLENWLGIQQNHYSPDVLTEKHIENREELNLVFAKVDWKLYFGP